MATGREKAGRLATAMRREQEQVLESFESLGMPKPKLF
jgi:hypothetical protein